MTLSSYSGQLKHDVFLSFRGEDTRKTFTIYLYRALKRKGIGAYMDDTELKKGEKLSPMLLKAIKESKISIIIISENYASSSWCLQELYQILECARNMKQLVLPIFYRVDPSSVRKCVGSFEKAFADHENCNTKIDEVKRWKDAFTEVGSLSGWHIRGDMLDRSEPEYIEEIIQVILKQLTHLQSPISYSRFVGIYHQKLQIESLLHIGQQNIRKIGIWGMGGIGKTTLAQVIYDEFSPQFEARCFLANVREEAEKRGMQFLRDKLLSIILDDENILISTPSIGSTLVKDRLSRKRVFIVLDDVNQWDQLELLALTRDHLGLGSRILVTSRDKQILNITVNEIYEVKKLDCYHSLQLFSKYAFGLDHPARDFRDLAYRVVYWAGGIPIALKVFGSALYQKSRGYWESVLNGLKQYPNPTIFNLMKISFDGLSDLERNIFLDIACFFKGEKSEKVRKILNSCYEGAADFGLSNLVDKCLLHISRDNDTFWMHDLVQEMGWNIARQEFSEPGERSRLFTPKDVSHVLKYNTGTKSIKGVLLDVSGIDEIRLKPDAFARMHNLTFVKIYDRIDPLYSKKECKMLISHQDLESLPGELRYFHWEHCPLKSLPSNFCPEQLVEVRFPYSNFKHLWHGIQNLVNLEVLDIKGCKNLSWIPNLSRATKIKELSVNGCSSLVELPSMTHLKSLPHFQDFRDLDNLKKFPEVPRHSSCLTLRNVGIEVVQESIGHLNHLQWLDVSFSRIENLPSTICAMESLSYLEFSRCPITKFPEIPPKLTKLILSGTQIEEMPSSAIGCLKSLVFLDMSGTRIQNFPSTIVMLKGLETVFLSGCRSITNFPNLPENIKQLDLDNTQIEEVPSSIARHKRLSLFSMRDCTKLASISTSICELKSLSGFYFSGCLSLESFPNVLETTGSLISLDLNSSVSISISFHNLLALTTLDLSGSNIIVISMGIKDLPNLLYLYLRCCKNLNSLPELPPSLKCVDARDCTSLEKVSRKIDQCISWNSMIFSNCRKLDEDAIDNIMAHARLRIHCMANITENKLYDAISDFSCCLPGNEIPYLFNYQSMNSSITIKMNPLSPYERFEGFAPCIVVDGKNYRNIGILCKYRLLKITESGDRQYSSFSYNWTCAPYASGKTVCFESSHLFLLFSDDLIFQSWDYHEASFEFYITGIVGDYPKVEKCGVYLIRAFEIHGQIYSDLFSVYSDFLISSDPFLISSDPFLLKLRKILGTSILQQKQQQTAANSNGEELEGSC